jgi:hypothetical protein
MGQRIPLHSGISIALQVTWLSIAEATLISVGTVDSKLAEGLGLKVFNAPLWASGNFMLLMLLLVVVVAELVVNDARRLHQMHLDLYGNEGTTAAVAAGWGSAR